jgi:homoserine kinase
MSERDQGIQLRPWVEAFAPATVSNLGPGFDVLGMALAEPGDKVRARRSEVPGVRLLKITGDEGRLPLESDANTACVAVVEMIRRMGLPEDTGIELELDKGLPLGSGLGSSGASACAALVAAAAALEIEVPMPMLIDCAREGERLACGTAHPDNVAPCLMGGAVLIPSVDPLRVVSLPVPSELWWAVYTPGCEVKTADARAVLPARVTLGEAVAQAGRLGALIHALHSSDLELLGESVNDEIIEPARARLIPGFLDAKAAALEAGALACTISGAGPTTFALARTEDRATVLLELLDEAFSLAGVPGRGLVGQAGAGARVLGRLLN